MYERATHAHEIGTVVLARPKWPNKPAFGIWTSDTVLVTEGRPAKISGYRSVDHRGVPEYSVQFDRKGDGTFYDAHWPLREDEIVEVLS
jgi:hypothetical protein